MENKKQERDRTEDEKKLDRGANTGGRKLPENSKEELDERLDEGVEETFPASDPVSVKITK
jgi:hypothetical protein